MTGEAVPGATCASHPTEGVAASCARCGAFICARCVAAAGEPLCAPCWTRARAVGAGPITVDAIVREGFALPFRVAPQAVPLALLAAIGAIAQNIYSEIVLQPQLKAMTQAMTRGHIQRPDQVMKLYREMFRIMAGVLGWSMAISLVANSVAIAGLAVVYGRALRGEPAGGVALPILRRAPSVLVVNVVYTLMVLVGMVACCVPGIAAVALFALAPIAVVLGEQGPFSALRDAWRLSRPRFWQMLGIEAIAMAVVMAGASVGAGVLAGARQAGLPGSVLGAIVAGLMAAVATLPMYAMNSTLYLRLRALERGAA